MPIFALPASPEGLVGTFRCTNTVVFEWLGCILPAECGMPWGVYANNVRIYSAFNMFCLRFAEYNNVDAFFQETNMDDFIVT